MRNIADLQGFFKILPRSANAIARSSDFGNANNRNATDGNLRDFGGLFNADPDLADSH